jgi:hypothetical protein
VRTMFRPLVSADAPGIRQRRWLRFYRLFAF